MQNEPEAQRGNEELMSTNEQKSPVDCTWVAQATKSCQGAIRENEAAAQSHGLGQGTTPDLRAMLVKAREGLAGGLWDYGPGQNEHQRCDDLIAEIDAVLASCKPTDLAQVLDALRVGRVACEWAGKQQDAEKIGEAMEAARRLAGDLPTNIPYGPDIPTGPYWTSGGDVTADPHEAEGWMLEYEAGTRYSPPESCPACELCNQPITSGMVAVWCPMKEQCALVGDNWDSVQDFKEAFKEVK
jgi:hypothetical protein